MRTGILRTLTVAFIALTAAASCAKTEAEQADEAAAKNIAAFVSAQLSADSTRTATYNRGVVRVTLTEGNGEGLKKGGKVTFHYAGYTFTSANISASNMFASNMSSAASESGWNLSGEDAFMPVEMTLGKSVMLKGLELGLEGVRSGEDCYILFVSEYGYGKHNYGTISANTALAYRISVENVEN